jgi:hypothetical protein
MGAVQAMPCLQLPMHSWILLLSTYVVVSIEIGKNESCFAQMWGARNVIESVYVKYCTN